MPAAARMLVWIPMHKKKPNAAEQQPKRIVKKGVLPPKWCYLDTYAEGERHEDAFALRREVYQPDRSRAFLF
jgi:hypothetical protein